MGLVAGAVAQGAEGSRWTAPALLAGCAGVDAPAVVFPSDRPTHATGPGAIIWSASPRCPGGEGARVAAIGASDVPGSSLAPRARSGARIAPRGPLTVSGAPHGEIVIAGAGSDGDGLLVEGGAGGPFAPLTTPTIAATPIALATAYQGDVAIAAGELGSGRLSVRVQRHFSPRLDRSSPARGAPAPGASGASGASAERAGSGGSPQLLSVAMDFRSDALAVWSENGAIYAHDLPASGAAHPVQRIAPAGAHTTIATLLSDDNRGIVVWAEQRGQSTSVYLDQSATGVRFGAPRLLERVHDPGGLRSPPGSPRLVRLSSESVMLAWAGVSAGHWVVRTAAIDQRGLQQVDTIAAPGVDELLSDLAPGPLGEALVTWTEPGPDPRRQRIFASRGTESAPGRTFFGEGEEVARAGAGADPAVAFDPDSDRALAVWHGAGGSIEYAIRSPGAGP